MIKKTLLSILTLALLISSGASVSLAQDGDQANKSKKGTGADVSMKARLNDTALKAWKNWTFNSGIAGTVTAVSGTTITIKAGENNAVYTIDTTNAKIMMGKDTITTANVMVGNAIFVQGVINGNTVVATNIAVHKASDGLKSAKKIEHGFAGMITAVSGSSITVLAKNGTTYNVNVSSAKIWSGKNNVSTSSTLTVGKTIIVDGTITGTSVAATNVYVITLPTPSISAGTIGTVTAISGTTITMLSANGTTYSVNATNAELKSARDENVSLRTITVGDSITVRGTIVGSTIEATKIVETKIGHGKLSNIAKFFKKLFGNRNN